MRSRKRACPNASSVLGDEMFGVSVFGTVGDTFSTFGLAPIRTGLARDAVDESTGVASDVDTTAGTDVALIALGRCMAASVGDAVAVV